MAKSKRPERKAKDKRKRKDKHPPAKDTGKGESTGSLTEHLKGKSTQSGADAMAATPGMYPPDSPNDPAVYTTGPGTVVAYNYDRQGTYAEEYAIQQSQQDAANPALAGPGQLVSSGAANNPG